MMTHPKQHTEVFNNLSTPSEISSSVQDDPWRRHHLAFDFLTNMVDKDDQGRLYLTKMRLFHLLLYT